MGGLEHLVSALGLSFASGITLYATVLLVGLAHRFEWFTFLPERLEILSHPVVLWTAAILYALESHATRKALLEAEARSRRTFEHLPIGLFRIGSDALGTAEAIVEHPLAARVIVNRVWKWHFGTGIVNTPSNLGRVGERR